MDVTKRSLSTHHEDDAFKPYSDPGQCLEGGSLDDRLGNGDPSVHLGDDACDRQEGDVSMGGHREVSNEQAEANLTGSSHLRMADLESPILSNKNFCECCRRRCLCLPSWLSKYFLWIHIHLTKYFTYPILFGLFYTALLGLNYDLVKPPECRRLLIGPYTVNQSEDIGNGSVEGQTVIECRGGEVLTVLLYYCFGFGVGELFELMHLPGLVGMLGSGLFLRNIGTLLTSETVYREDDAPGNVSTSGQTWDAQPSFNLTEPLVRLAGLSVVEHSLSGTLRQIALMTILIRAGLGLDPKALQRLLGAVLRLTVIPCMTEALTLMLVTHLLIRWPLAWGAVQGFICAAVSPAILVPSVIRLQAGGWGVAKGIPTLLVASCSLDDVVAITCFSVALAFAVATGESVVRIIFSAPAEAIGGVLVGLLSGGLVCLVPTADMTYGLLLRASLFVCITITQLVGSVAIQASGAGALACLATAFTLATGLKAGLPWTLKQSYNNAKKKAMPAMADRQLSDECVENEETVFSRNIAAHVIHMELKTTSTSVNTVNEVQGAGKTYVDSTLEENMSNCDRNSPSQRVGSNRSAARPTDRDRSLTAEESGLQCLSKFCDGGAVAWLFIQPLLFTLIGAEVNLRAVDSKVIVFGVASLLAGLGARMLATVLAVLPNKFTMRERLFIAISWLPKATVQAALGAVALDTARRTNAPAQVISWGETVLTIAVLSIMMTGPLGAVLIHLTAPCLLSRDLPNEDSEPDHDQARSSTAHNQHGH